MTCATAPAFSARRDGELARTQSLEDFLHHSLYLIGHQRGGDVDQPLPHSSFGGPVEESEKATFNGVGQHLTLLQPRTAGPRQGHAQHSPVAFMLLPDDQAVILE